MGARKSLIKFKVNVPLHVRHEGAWFYSSCPPLDVHSQGRSRDEAIRNLIEAIQLFMESCFERGALEDALKELGFEAAHDNGQAAQEETIDVPLTLLAAKHVAEAQRC